MADNTIDSLNLEISADTSKAEKALGKLATTIANLATSLNGVNVTKFSNLSAGIRQMTSAMSVFSATTKTADFTRIANGLGKISSVDVQGVTAAANAIKTLATSISGMSSLVFDSQGIANIANAIALLGRKTVTQAKENIPALTSALQNLAAGLAKIDFGGFDYSALEQLTGSISKLGGAAAGRAAQGNIVALGSALKQMMQTLSTAPKVSANLIQMTQALAQLASTGGRAGTATKSLISNFSLLPKTTSKAKGSFSGLAGAIGRFYATYWLAIRALGQFKKSIDLSSDLTEVQNVVDVTFGKMADKVDELASHSIKDFGMSELTVKQVAGRFQAMGTAMGISQEKMSDMSLELTKLTGDMASFYNVEQNDVAKSLQSVFTGETEPLRKYGLDLTNATLKEWAMKQGIDANVTSMSQAQKTMLRYAYVMSNTTAAQNDFARTSGTWANQTRILAQQFEELGSVVGGTLISAFKPLITMLNSVMEKVIQFAKTVANALGAIFGWTIEIDSGGIANDFENAGAGADEMADGTGDAADNAKKLSKYIAGWQEVYNMTTDDSKKKGSGGAGGIDTGALEAARAQLVQMDSIFDQYRSNIDSLQGLGQYIGVTLASAMNDINWDAIYEKARGFGTGLAQFLNGLISPNLFGAVGETIASALNTAVYAALAFGTTFDWTNFGESIAAGVNRFFSTFDFASLAQTLNVWAKGILDTAITAIDNIDWTQIGTDIGTFLAELDFEGIGHKVGELLWKAIDAGMKVWGASFDAAPVETAIFSAVGVLKFTGIGKLITDKIVKNFTDAKKDFIDNIKTKISGWFSTAFTGLVLKVQFAGFNIVDALSAVGGISSLLNSPFVMEIGRQIDDAISQFISTYFGETVLNAMANSLTIVTGAGIGAVFAGPIGAVVGGLAGLIVDAIATVDWSGDVWGKISDKIFNFDDAKAIWEEFKGYWNAAFTADSLSELAENVVKGIGTGITAALVFLFEPLTDLFDYTLSKLKELFGIHSPAEETKPIGQYILLGIAEGFAATFNEWLGKLTSWKDQTISTFNSYVSNVISSVATWFSALPGKAYDEIIKIKDKITQWGTQTISFFENTVPTIISNVVGFFGKLTEEIKGVGENVIKGLWEGMNNMVSWIGDKISGFVNGVIDGFKKGFDEHSPSKVAFQIGDYFTIGLGNGIVDKFGDIYDDIDQFTSRIAATQISIPKLDYSVPTVDYQPDYSSLSEAAGVMRFELDASMAENEYQQKQQLDVLERIITAINNKELKIGDDAVFNATRRGQQKFQQRTFRTGWAGVD